MQIVATAAMSLAALLSAPAAARPCGSAPTIAARQPASPTSPEAARRRGDCLGANRREFYDPAAGRYYWRDPRTGRMRWENGAPKP